MAKEADQPLRTAETGAITPAGSFQVGDRVHLAATVRYLKTADPMPMLRPPDLVSMDEVGEVRELRALDSVAVRFRRGTFLLAAEQLRAVATSG